jgi:hypothetical protein
MGKGIFKEERMKLGALAGGTCRVCGSDTYGADIGCGCIHMYHQAGFIVLRQHDKDSLEYNYGIQMKFIMNDFCSWYEEKMNRCDGNIDKMFRTDFNRQFFPSVYDQYKQKGYVSKKQLDVVKQKIYPNGMYDVWEKIENQKRQFMQDFIKEHDGECIEVARNLWKSKK